MEKRKSKVLVTWDFTEKSDIAFQHALSVNKFYPCDITLIHIIKKEEGRFEAEKRMRDAINLLKDKYAYEAAYIIKVGTIFSTISEEVNANAVSLVFMGTHGMKGMQKVTGSWAFKVFLKSRAPFIMVQEPPKSENLKKIVVPINFRFGDREVSKWIDFMHKHFNPKFFLFKLNRNDAKFKRGISANLIFAKKYLHSKDIEYETIEAVGKKDYATESIEFAKEENADMILIMSPRHISFPDYFFGVKEQNIICNKYNIPVMAINPRPVKMTGSFSSTAG